MKPIAQLIVTAAVVAFSNVVVAAPAPATSEAPDALVKRISNDVMDTVRGDKDIQSGNRQKIMDLVNSKILPYVDSNRMTALAAGRFWRQASPEQKQQLAEQFRQLLVYTYSGALSQIKDQKIEFKPMRSDPADTEVEVRSQVLGARGDAIELDYRLSKTPDGWKIYDINVLGAWLVETYKGNFAAEINKGGVDGLIRTLIERNKKLAAGPMTAPRK